LDESIDDTFVSAAVNVNVSGCIFHQRSDFPRIRPNDSTAGEMVFTKTASFRGEMVTSMAG
jgi:hypothetical protein